jgi:hypothetical protein
LYISDQAGKQDEKPLGKEPFHPYSYKTLSILLLNLLTYKAVPGRKLPINCSEI